MAISKDGSYSVSKTRKKTRQGMGRGTKCGRPNGKHYKKKYVGQGR